MLILLLNEEEHEQLIKLVISFFWNGPCYYNMPGSVTKVLTLLAYILGIDRSSDRSL